MGDLIADKIENSIKIKLFSKYRSEAFDMKSSVKEAMENYKAVIFISSTGIAVRSIAPYINTKLTDPAVIVIDCTGKFVISLLSGHLGGANRLTLQIAKIIKAQPVITTASDNIGFEAPDVLAQENNLVITDMDIEKDIAALLVNNKKVAFIDEDKEILCPMGYVEAIDEAAGAIFVTNKLNINSSVPYLKLIRKNLVIGIGCKKNYPFEKMYAKLEEAFIQNNLDIRAIKTIATVEVKKDEEAILKLKKALDCHLDIWSIEQIRKIEWKFEGSAFVKKTIGVKAVCEPCVELSNGKIIVEKLALDGMTLCIGKC
jgi:cobalt-precorrin 5A hydrolase